jgi:hypothetical protein
MIFIAEGWPSWCNDADAMGSDLTRQRISELIKKQISDI